MRETQIVYATDLLGDVETGLALATRLARERSATLLILHVVPLSMESGEAMLYGAMDLSTGASKRRLEDLTPPDPAVPFLRIQEIGDPEDCIAAFVERQQASLLVMEAAPRPWYRRAFGSRLIERLRDRCSCPMVTYHPTIKKNRPRPLIFLEREHREVSREILSTVLNARVEALLSWMRLHEQACIDVAMQRTVTDAVASLYRQGARGGVFMDRVRNLLCLELAEHQRAWDAIGVEVVTEGSRLLGMGVAAKRTEAFVAFVERVRVRGSAVSVPLEAEDGGSERYITLTGAAVPGLDGGAVLLFAFDARRDFLRILAQPGPAPSAETYAFDEAGIMLSNSRFPHQLRQVGMLPPDLAVQTPRRVRVCDPGGNLLIGAGQLTATSPLTRAVAAATSGQDGCDFTGYRDYRGIEVVGVWRWLADYGFGVTAEVDREND